MNLTSGHLPHAVSLPWRYEAVRGHHDEMLAADGVVRAHWQGLVEELGEIGADELSRRWMRGRQLIHENGVTYNVYGDPKGLDRPWNLNPVPLVISSAEWTRIEAAVAQRARLLNAVLADVYGQQKLLEDGRLPAALVLGQPSFLKPLHGLATPRGIYLHLCAVDLARAPDGTWWVIGDRTGAPSGMGYALENRLVMTRTLPDVFRDCRVTRLAEFFGQWNDSTLSLAAGRREQPRVVLLTPGHYNETYFEHAYLARYLGYTLAEGRDLTVRDGKVLLKSLSGLLPVDVIVRRTDDAFCDPLELREDSMLGIPGLVQAVRLGNVVVANALGSGLAQAPGLAPFLPGLCRHLFGENLLMPTVATWWCGQAGALAEVCERIATGGRGIVIKAASGAQMREPVFAEQIDARQRDNLVRQIRHRPRDFVAQEQVRLSTAPSWDDGLLTPRHLMVRVFAAAKSDGTWAVMPGGLTRISGSTESTVVSMQRGGGSKDTWVLSDGPVNPHSPLRPPGAPVEITRAGFVLPSRVADNLYWLGRYAERVEFGVRVARAVLRRMTDDLEAVELPGLLDVLSGADTRTDQRWSDMPLSKRVIEQLFLEKADGLMPAPVRLDVEQAQRIAGSVRDRISSDAWRIITRLADEFVRPRVSSALQLNHTVDLLDRSMITLAAFAGQAIEGMTHDKGWRFLDVGRRVERVLHLAGLLKWGFAADAARIRHRNEAARNENPDDTAERFADTGPAGRQPDARRLEAVLDIANCAMTYRSRYLTTVQAPPVLDLLLLDESNPRSIASQLAALLDHIQHLPLKDSPAILPADQRLLVELLTEVRVTDVELLANEPSPRVHLSSLLDRLYKALPALSDILTRMYLSHARPTHQSRSAGELDIRKMQ